MQVQFSQALPQGQMNRDAAVQPAPLRVLPGAGGDRVEFGAGFKLPNPLQSKKARYGAGLGALLMTLIFTPLVPLNRAAVVKDVNGNTVAEVSQGGVIFSRGDLLRNPIPVGKINERGATVGWIVAGDDSMCQGNINGAVVFKYNDSAASIQAYVQQQGPVSVVKTPDGHILGVIEDPRDELTPQQEAAAACEIFRQR